MGQRISHLYTLVTFPRFYDAFQSLLGGRRARQRFVADVLRPEPGMTILDVGCGPGSYLPFLPQVDYTGIDLNPKHIEFARAKYAGRGRFLVGDASKGLPMASRFDRVIVAGLLHHLSDAGCMALFHALSALVAEHGEIVTIDPVHIPRQRSVARLMNRYDSGLNIRTAAEYLALARDWGLTAQGRVYSDLLRIPYDNFCMTLQPVRVAAVQARPRRAAGARSDHLVFT